jgi:hypothetical protein
MRRALVLTFLAVVCGCASHGGFHSPAIDGSEGPLTVEFVDLKIERLGSRMDDVRMATLSFDVSNNSQGDVMVTKIAIAQRGISTLRLDNPLRAFNRTIAESATERFDMSSRLSTTEEVVDARDTVLALRVEITLDTNITYEYPFEVPVRATEL